MSGTMTSGLMVVGDSPWIEEIRYGKPFQGPSGMLLDSQLRRAGIRREDVVVTNTMMCKPPRLGWTDGGGMEAAMAIQQCRPHLDALIDRLQPKCILTLGGVAMQRVIGVGGLTNRQAYIHDTAYGIPAVPTFHPSNILQGNHKLTQCMYFAIQRCKEIISNPNWSRMPVEYLVDPPVEQAADYLFNGWRGIREGATLVAPEAELTDRPTVDRVGYPLAYSANPGSILMESLKLELAEMLRYTTKPWPRSTPVPRIPLLVIDLETPNSHKLDEEEAEDDPSYTIIRLGLSVSPYTALTVPWVEPYIGLVRQAVASAAVVIVWNGDGFDLPRMLANGIGWQGEIHDAMYMWHFLQSDMLKSLGFVSPFYTDMPPWKHLSGADLPYYTACDADAEMRNYLGIRADLERAGRWPRFVRHCIRAAEVFRRPHVGRIYLDAEAQGSLKQRLIEERAGSLATLQTQVPETIKRRKVLKTKPKKDIDEYRVVQEPCFCTVAKDGEQQVVIDFVEEPK